MAILTRSKHASISPRTKRLAALCTKRRESVRNEAMKKIVTACLDQTDTTPVNKEDSISESLPVHDGANCPMDQTDNETVNEEDSDHSAHQLEKDYEPTEEELEESGKLIEDYMMAQNYQYDQRMIQEEDAKKTIMEIEKQEEEDFKTECWQFEQVHNLQPLGVINRLEFEAVKKLVAYKESQGDLAEKAAQPADGSQENPFILE
jgi:hypothetical protein